MIRIPRGIFERLPGALGLLLAAAFVSTGAIDAAEIYKWKDEKGVVHYSNTPPPQGTDATVLDESKGKVSVVPAYKSPDGAASASDAALQDRVRRLERQLEQERAAQQQQTSSQADADAYARWREDCLAQRRTDCDDPNAAAVPVYGYPGPTVVRPPTRPVKPGYPSVVPPGYTVGPGPGGIGGQYVPNPPRPRPNPSEGLPPDPRPIPTPR